MNLAQGNQRPEFASISSAQLPQKKLAIALNGGTRILLRESEIQRIAAVHARYAARPRRKAVHQPGKLAQLARAKDGQLGFV